MDRLEQERLHRLARMPGADRATRMDDISSDEDDVSCFQQLRTPETTVYLSHLSQG